MLQDASKSLLSRAALVGIPVNAVLEFLHQTAKDEGSKVYVSHNESGAFQFAIFIPKKTTKVNLN